MLLHHDKRLNVLCRETPSRVLELIDQAEELERQKFEDRWRSEAQGPGHCPRGAGRPEAAASLRDGASERPVCLGVGTPGPTCWKATSAQDDASGCKLWRISCHREIGSPSWKATRRSSHEQHPESPETRSRRRRRRWTILPAEEQRALLPGAGDQRPERSIVLEYFARIWGHKPYWAQMRDKEVPELKKPIFRNGTATSRRPRSLSTAGRSHFSPEVLQARMEGW